MMALARSLFPFRKRSLPYLITCVAGVKRGGVGRGWKKREKGLPLFFFSTLLLFPLPPFLTPATQAIKYGKDRLRSWAGYILKSLLTVDATINNQAFSHDRCIIFLGLNYIKGDITFLNSVRKGDIEAQVEFSLKVTERATVTCYRCNRFRKTVCPFTYLHFSEF